ncbi:helix-turn-helix domain-containing protein [Mycobacteroides abscessus subsp. abscessus]|uniref:helix-turn-helix domain-containing protein n=1 Tax=Mycobacteroides abscessus TaxID=36809 RepID=UPI0009266CBB|nr:helix-turn-helix domain-containing protein [Mycobacteroides abscessus]MBN7551827.1 helix-turn-helix domain-containing protein [Mycobacteroides abscessus subsp. abscessus]MDO3096610.1 helix-turn-helix domain-containing protein [Mycobacteroides abscessus subsp. abscessus]MDO3286865.1 helix-turn-helix domain-containing protein [Mycobacteroides abscessus subsp. abscessus]MDO3371038.1 helix-turn-helix domain-containing protein [Mycobacteroides abscessus subsp. abscessus]QSM69812.1 helix-turn-hel
MDQLVGQLEHRLLPLEDVMARLQVGRTKIYEFIASGQLRSIKVGKRRVVSEAALREFIAAIDGAE